MGSARGVRYLGNQAQNWVIAMIRSGVGLGAQSTGSGSETNPGSVPSAVWLVENHLN